MASVDQPGHTIDSSWVSGASQTGSPARPRNARFAPAGMRCAACLPTCSTVDVNGRQATSRPVALSFTWVVSAPRITREARSTWPSSMIVAPASLRQPFGAS